MAISASIQIPECYTKFAIDRNTIQLTLCQSFYLTTFLVFFGLYTKSGHLTYISSK